MPELYALPSKAGGSDLLGSMDASLSAMLRGRTPDAVLLDLEVDSLPRISDTALAAYLGRWLTEAREASSPTTRVLVSAPFRLGAIAACSVELSGWKWAGTVGNGSTVVQLGHSGTNPPWDAEFRGGPIDGPLLADLVGSSEGLVCLPHATSWGTLASLILKGHGFVARCVDPKRVADRLGARPASSSDIWQASFLALLRRGVDINVAAHRAGVHRSLPYSVRKKDAAFAAAWDRAVGKTVAV